MRSIIKAGLKRISGTPESGHHRQGERQATVIAVAAQKGGVGKTTTTTSLAAALARFCDLRVLVVDLDPQGHVTTALSNQVRRGGGPLSALLTDEHNALEVMDITTGTEIDNLRVTPFDPGLASAEDLVGTRIGKEFILRDALKYTRTHYDVILLDCPPNLGNLTLNGLVAADEVLIPCDPSPLALKGVAALVDTISTVAGRLNPDLDVMGVLLTRVDGRNRTLNQQIMGELEDDAVIPVQIGINASLSRAQADGTDIFSFAPTSRGAEQYLALAEWVADKVEG